MNPGFPLAYPNPQPRKYQSFTGPNINGEISILYRPMSIGFRWRVRNHKASMGEQQEKQPILFSYSEDKEKRIFCELRITCFCDKFERCWFKTSWTAKSFQFNSPLRKGPLWELSLWRHLGFLAPDVWENLSSRSMEGSQFLGQLGDTFLHTDWHLLESWPYTTQQGTNRPHISFLSLCFELWDYD